MRNSSFSLLFLSSLESMVTSQVSESLLLLPPPPEPPLSTIPLDLLIEISAPDAPNPPDPPDPPDTFGAADLSSFQCFSFTLTAARSHLFNCTTTTCLVYLLLVPLRVQLVRHLLVPTAGCRSWISDVVWEKHHLFSRFRFLIFSLRSQSQQLPQYEEFKLHVIHCLSQFEVVRHLFCLALPQYEVLLPQHEVVQNVPLSSLQYFCMLVVFSDVSGIVLLRKIGDGFRKVNLGFLVSDLFVCPWWFLQLHTFLWLRISSQFEGSSKRCMITLVAKLLAAFYALVIAASSGSNSLSVAFDSRGVISPINTKISLLSCLCVMFAYINVYVICFAFDAAVFLANLIVLLYLLKNYSIDGV